MAVPLAAAALVSGLNMLLLQGSKAVVKKYGKNGLKEIAKYGKKQTEIARIAEKNRTLKATEKGKSSAERALKEDRLVKESRGRASNTRKSKSRNERLEEEAGPRFDPDTGGYEMLDDVPLQFAKGGLLDRDKKMSGGQAKLDVDKDGELTAKDFEALRERTQKQMGGMMAGMPIGNEEEMQEPMAEKTVSEEMQEELEPLPEKPMEEPMMSEESQMDSDDEMEDNYLDFVINQALSEEEEEMLMNELESNPDLSLLFDKVMDVAQEFSGAGPVEGPGSEVSDSIPARLSDGEFVFTAKAVEEIGADTLMSMMKEAEVNADERQQVAYGGTVTTTVRQEEDDYDFGANPEEQELRNAAVSEQMRNLNPRLR